MRFKFNSNSKKITSTIAGASIYISVYAILARGFGFLREILFANVFGLSANYDLYLVGSVLPITLNVIILSIGQNFIIPKFNELKTKSEKLALEFIQYQLIMFFVFGTLLSITLYFSADYIISFYFQSASLEIKNITLNIFRLFLLSIPLTGIISVIIAYQQSLYEFRFYLVSNILLNLLMLVIVYYLRRLNIYSIPVGYNIGIIAQLIYLMLKSRDLIFQIKYKFNLQIKKSRILLPVITIILIESIGQLYLISDRYFFSEVTKGGISALTYAHVIFLLPISVFSIALSTAIFPKFSELTKKQNFFELKSLLNNGLSTTLVVFMPIMLLFISKGDYIIKVIYEHGQFNSTATELTSEALIFYSVSLALYASYGILNKLIYSIDEIKNLLIITIIGTLIKIFANIILVKSLKQNGLALSTSISYCFFFMAAHFILSRKLKFSNMYYFKEFLFFFMNGVFAFLICKLSFSFIRTTYLNEIYFIVVYLIIYTLTLLTLKNNFVMNFVTRFRTLKISF